MNTDIRRYLSITALFTYASTIQAELEHTAYKVDAFASLHAIEPTSLALFGLGLVVLGFTRKKQNNRD